MALTVLQVRSARPGRHADGKGLYLLVKPSGARSWVLRVVMNGRRRDFGLGAVSYDLPRADAADIPLGSRRILSLQEARSKAEEGRRLAKAGIDPAAEWKKGRQPVPSFEKASEQYLEGMKAGWKNEKHAAQWISTLRTYVFPKIGQLAVDQVDPAAIQSVLLPIWLLIPETARRVRQRIGAVLDFSNSQGWRPIEAPMKAVSKGLPKQPRRTGHYEALAYPLVPALMAKINSMEPTISRLALQFTILNASRSGEVRLAVWEEFNLSARTWIIPKERMKAELPHSVPLSDQSMEILETMRDIYTGTAREFVFPGQRRKPLSDMSLTAALRSAGCVQGTVHGMRSSFRDWVAELMPTTPGDVAEAALAHEVKDKTEAAYRRTKYLDQRRPLMQDWADYLSSAPEVVLLGDSD